MSLASYAVTSENTDGRMYPEAAPSKRGEFARDYARIIHSAAFRRLQYKTQVFSNEMGDLFRTRATHSTEVAQLARTGASALGLNQDLAEALGVGHDLGHPPLGHVGQEVLNSIMKPYGGFEHNWQALRIVDELEHIDDRYHGLNLMAATREGLLKHCSPSRAALIGEAAARHVKGHSPSLEAQLVDFCDSIAYNHADVEDSLMMGYLSLDDLRELPWFEKAWPKENLAHEEHQRVAIRVLRERYGYFMDDLLENSQKNIDQAKLKTLDDVKNSPGLIGFSENVQNEHYQIKRFLRKKVYGSEKLNVSRDIDANMLANVLTYYLAHPQKMAVPDTMARFELTPRGVCDFVSGMTDRYVAKVFSQISDTPEFKKLPVLRVVFDDKGEASVVPGKPKAACKHSLKP